MRRILAALLLAGAAARVDAGPWAAGRGHFYAKVGGSRLDSMVLAAPDGTEFDIPRFVKEEAGIFVAVGVTERLTAIVNLPLYRSSDLEDFGRAGGLGDLQGGVQVQLGQRGPWVFAVRGMVQVPTGDETLAEGLLPTGSGVWEGEVLLGTGRSFAGGRFYGFVDAGHQLRGGGLTDAFAYGGQVGWNAHRRLVLAAGMRGVEPYDQSPRVARGSPVGLSDRVGYLVYGPTVIVGLGSGVGVQLDVEWAGRARNLAKGTTARLGLSWAR